MREVKPIKDPLDELNKIMSNLKNIDIKISMIKNRPLLFSIHYPSYVHLVLTLLYDRATISMEDVKSSLYSKELRRRYSVRVRYMLRVWLHGVEQLKGVTERFRDQSPQTRKLLLVLLSERLS